MDTTEKPLVSPIESHLADPAGFIIRTVAHLIDSVIILAVVTVACTVFGAPTFMDIIGASTIAEAYPTGIATTIGLTVGISTLYHAVLESSKWQATVGKKLLSLTVTDLDDERIGFFRALFRYIPKLIIIGVFPLAMLVVAFNGYKRGIHDFIAGTMVYGSRL